MKQTWHFGALISGLITASLVAGMGLTYQLLAVPFAPFEIFNWITRILPGSVVTFGIDLMIGAIRLMGVNVAEAAKTAEQVIAILLFLFLGIIIGGVFFIIMQVREARPNLVSGLILGMIFGLPVVVIGVTNGLSGVHLLVRVLGHGIPFIIWGAAISWASGRLFPVKRVLLVSEEETRFVEKIDRRQFLIVLGTASASITVIGGGLAAILSSSSSRLEGSIDRFEESGGGEDRIRLLPNANDPVKPAPGTRPEYTPIEEHYKVFIQLTPTEIDGETWRLPITGLVDNPLMLSLEDLHDRYQQREQYVTLSCISGQIPTDLIGTTLWTGVSLRDVLADSRVRPEARYLRITSADGFYETVDLNLIDQDERIMLCYAWDGKPLPVDHGFPLRIWIPDRYGMKQPKWITGMDVTDIYKEGFWVERGWDEVAQVKTTSVIDVVAVDAIVDRDGQKLVPVGGIAFSGDRGISKVELRVDGGEWQEAQLRKPLSATTWAIWRYDWPFEPGPHTFEVRCAEGDGKPQVEESQPVRPSGETGIHRVEIKL